MKYTLHFGFELDIVFPFLHVRFIFLLQIYDLPVWFLMYAFCFLQRNDDENKKEIPCGAVFQSSRDSFRRILEQSQFFGIIKYLRESVSASNQQCDAPHVLSRSDITMPSQEVTLK